MFGYYDFRIFFNFLKYKENRRVRLSTNINDGKTLFFKRANCTHLP